MKLKYLYLLIFFVVICFFLYYINTNSKIEKPKEEKRAVFVSYIELGNYVKDKEVSVSKENIRKIIENVKSINFNTIILQVRSFSDAIYESNIFPWSITVSSEEGKSPGYDVLSYFIKEAHKANIEIHAWINPYRIRTNLTKEEISVDNPAYKWLNTNNVKSLDKGIYYNPASSEVEDLIVSGVEELVKNYDIDGIHFDDYFYPGEDIDLEEYEQYKENKDLSTFRLETINHMIKRVYKTIKDEDENILFGISPEGNIENNYNNNYADVYTWGEKDGYVDYLMPQIYYGFYNSTKPYIEVINEWEKVVKNENIKLLPALAFYKVGTEDNYAKDGKYEWCENNDIIMREVILGRNLDNYEGFSLFRYDYLFNEELETNMTLLELENLQKIIK